MQMCIDGEIGLLKEGVEIYRAIYADEVLDLDHPSPNNLLTLKYNNLQPDSVEEARNFSSHQVLDGPKSNTPLTSWTKNTGMAFHFANDNRSGIVVRYIIPGVIDPNIFFFDPIGNIESKLCDKAISDVRRMSEIHLSARASFEVDSTPTGPVP